MNTMVNEDIYYFQIYLLTILRNVRTEALISLACRVLWLTPIILATWEAEIWGSRLQASLGK
jgi:hypothetical protein